MASSHRLATLEDIPAMLPLMKAFYEHEALHYEDATARAALAELIGHPELGHIWLMFWDEELAGYIALALGFSLEFGGRDAFIDEFYVDERFRVRGLGNEILQIVENELRVMGVKALHLEVEMSNTSAKRFYVSKGFEDRSRYQLMSKRL